MALYCVYIPFCFPATDHVCSSECRQTPASVDCGRCVPVVCSHLHTWAETCRKQTLQWTCHPGGKYGPYYSGVVFGLGRIFNLERSAIFMTEFRARLELGAINFHLKPCMFTRAKIGSPFEVIILALNSKVSSYQLTSTEFLITTYFLISIK